MKKYTLIIIIVLSFLSIGLGGYVFYDLVLTSDDKCAPIIEDDNINQNNNSNNSGLNNDKYFDVDHISEIKLSYFSLGPNVRDDVIIDDNEVIKNVISEFNNFKFKRFVPYGIGFEGYYIEIVYDDASVISIFGMPEKEIAILDRRERDFENKVLTNSVIVELVNELSFDEIYSKYYK